MQLSSRNQVAVTSAAFVGFTGSTLVMPFLALYIQELGVTDVGQVALWTGLTLGATPLVTALCAPFWGRIADRYGNKILVQRSLLSFVVVMAAMAYATEAWHLFVLRALQGFVAGYGPLTLSMAAASVPRERMAGAIGTVQTAQRIGPTVGPVIGGVLAGAVGHRHAFLVAAAVYLVALVLITVLYTEPPRDADVARRATVRMPFRDILSFENFLLALALILGTQLVERSFEPVLPLYLKMVGYSAARVSIVAGVIFSTLAVAGALGHQLAATLLPRLSARRIIVLALLVAAAGLSMFASVTSLAMLVAGMALVGLGIGTVSTVAYSAAGAVVPRHAHGASFGLLTGASLLGMSFGPMLGGVVAARSITVVFVMGVVIFGLLAIVVRRTMVVRTRQVESPIESDV